MASNLDAFSCQECGTCCRWSGYVLLTNQDMTQIAKHLDLSEEDFIDQHTRLAANRQQLALLDQPSGACAFLEENRCQIYSARPEQCRTFPYKWRVEGCPALDLLKKY